MGPAELAVDGEIRAGNASWEFEFLDCRGRRGNECGCDKGERRGKWSYQPTSRSTNHGVSPFCTSLQNKDAPVPEPTAETAPATLG